MYSFDEETFLKQVGFAYSPMMSCKTTLKLPGKRLTNDVNLWYDNVYSVAKCRGTIYAYD